MPRFQVYKITESGRFIHVTSLIADSLKDAIIKSNDPKLNGGDKGFYVTGIPRNTGEDISRNFPYHITRRIENNGKRVKFMGSLYSYLNKHKEKCLVSKKELEELRKTKRISYENAQYVSWQPDKESLKKFREKLKNNQ